MPQPGKVQAVVFDLSGTTIDFGSRGPVVAIVELFARHGVTLTEAEARASMGAHKRDHVRALLEDPAISLRWRQRHRVEPNLALLDQLYGEFIPLQVQVLKRHCEVLPGVVETAAELRRRGIGLAATTGFDSPILKEIIPAITAQGFTPEVFVGPDMVGGGRPAPWMAFYAARQLGLYPMQTFVKVGDTGLDIAEAHNAGMWSVAVLATGNEIGLSESDLKALPTAEREARFRAARERFWQLGAHYVIDSVQDLPPVIEAINTRLAAGERP
ncbi:MAG: phosphonoacetaldehyde hydrolase [Bryobacteraceae bacterium]|nr:phosphonoacetaldehyde hydrolase [Bryobacteraceae bacterium]MDW8377785.1 phosphonoacetaldehyde hydrolase [Bryobacterales bacterium]